MLHILALSHLASNSKPEEYKASRVHKFSLKELESEVMKYTKENNAKKKKIFAQ